MRNGLLVAWAGCLFLATALVVAVAEREAIVRAAPGLAGVYSALGLPVSHAGGSPR